MWPYIPLIGWMAFWTVAYSSATVFVLWRRGRYGHVSPFLPNPPKWQRSLYWLRRLKWKDEVSSYLSYTVVILCFSFGSGVLVIGLNTLGAWCAFTAIMGVVTIVSVHLVVDEPFDARP